MSRMAHQICAVCQRWDGAMEDQVIGMGSDRRRADMADPARDLLVSPYLRQRGGDRRYSLQLSPDVVAPYGD